MPDTVVKVVPAPVYTFMSVPPIANVLPGLTFYDDLYTVKLLLINVVLVVVPETFIVATMANL